MGRIYPVNDLHLALILLAKQPSKTLLILPERPVSHRIPEEVEARVIVDMVLPVKLPVLRDRPQRHEERSLLE